MNKYNFKKWKPFVDSVVILKVFSRTKQPVFYFNLFVLFCLVCLLIVELAAGANIGVFFSVALVSICCFSMVQNTKKLSSEDQMVFLFWTWTIFQALVAVIFIVAGFTLKINGKNDWLEPIILGITWLPSLEFLNFFQKNPYLLFVTRLIITIITLIWH